MRERVPENVGVINPYALAEVVLKRRVNWRRIHEPQKLLEKTLCASYEKLFDPIHNSPLYAGLELDAANLTMKRSEAPMPTDVRVGGRIEAGAGVVWVDPGDFFEEATEITDPQQGALGDCYFIAALASVAWARPYVIAHRNRATGPNQTDMADMIEFYKSGKSEKVDVTERLPLLSPANNFIYARSTETGEIWPAVYEKAYAKWRTNTQSDQPDYNPLAGGDPVGALAQLTGLTPYYQWNSSLSAHDIWQKIRQHCVSAKTFDPMVAWTYASAPSPNVNYSNAHIVANHAYSILGWQYANNQEYVVLRNPWGNYEATLNVDGSTWVAYDAPYNGGTGWWRSVPLSKNDGIFALRADTFKAYYAGFGWVQ